MINPGDLTVEKGSTGCSLDGRGTPPSLQPTLEDLDVEMVPVGGGEVEEGDAEEIEPEEERIMDNNGGGEIGQPELKEYNEPGYVKIERSKIDTDNSGEETAATEIEKKTVGRRQLRYGRRGRRDSWKE